MLKERVVLDTNCLIVAISARNKYNVVWQKFLEGRYILCLTTDILEEYEEVLARNISPLVAKYVMSAIVNSPNIYLTDVFFKFGLITQDPDDNKFVDCAIVSNARFIVTEDKHFSVLKNIDFPKIDVINIDTFADNLQK